MRVVISQSMLFPWVGLLEQVRLAEVFVHLDDVQFSKGSFSNRVQVKTAAGMRWLTLPMRELHLGQSIAEAHIQPVAQWRDRHMALLRESFEDAPFAADALELAAKVYSRAGDRLGALARESLMALVRYFGLDAGRRFVDSAELQVPGHGSERVLGMVRAVDGDRYITGHGAASYLDHEAFERAGVAVEYMDYQRLPYPQGAGEFTPYVTGLDLVAHCGRAGIGRICSETKHWRAFVDGSA